MPYAIGCYSYPAPSNESALSQRYKYKNVRSASPRVDFKSLSLAISIAARLRDEVQRLQKFDLGLLSEDKKKRA